MFPTCHDITPANYHLAVYVLEKLLRKGARVLIVSKPSRWCVDGMTRALEAYREQIMFRFTIGTTSAVSHNLWEPEAPSPEERLRCARWAKGRGFRVSISCEPFLGDAGQAGWPVEESAREHYENVADVSNGPIWFGLMNQIGQRALPGVPAVEVRRVEAMRESVNVAALFQALEGRPRVKFKESITKVMGLPAEVDEWPALRRIHQEGSDANL